MKKIVGYLIIGAAVLFAGYANAATTWSYAAATDGSYTCPEACFGFTTRLPPNTVESVGMASVGLNVQHPANFDIAISIDGVSYENTLVANPGVPFLVLARDNSGRSRTITVVFNTVKICQRTCHWHYHATGGTVQ